MGRSIATAPLPPAAPRRSEPRFWSQLPSSQRVADAASLPQLFAAVRRSSEEAPRRGGAWRGWPRHGEEPVGPSLRSSLSSFREPFCVSHHASGSRYYISCLGLSARGAWVDKVVGADWFASWLIMIIWSAGQRYSMHTILCSFIIVCILRARS